MTKKQNVIVFTLLFLGIVTYPLMTRITGIRGYAFMWVALTFSLAGLIYGCVVSWKAKRVENVKRMGLGMGIATAPILLRYLLKD